LKIIRNSFRCLNCGDERESVSRRDFAACSCGACFTDGGRSAKHMRRGGPPEFFLDTSVTTEEDADGYIEHLEEVIGREDRKLRLLTAVLERRDERRRAR
jgi:hypothetical protein